MQSFVTRRTQGLGILMILGVAMVGAGPTPGFARPAHVEPPLEFQLHVAGQTLPVAVDEEFTVTIAGEAVRMRLEVAPNRLFDNAGSIRFRYPSNMAFEHDDSTPGVGMWTFDGNDCVIMLVRIKNAEVGPEQVKRDLLGELRARFGRVGTEASHLMLGGRRFDGTRIVAKAFGQQLQIDVVVFTHGEESFVLTVQDSLDEGGQPTNEANRVRALLARTFEFPE